MAQTHVGLSRRWIRARRLVSLVQSPQSKNKPYHPYRAVLSPFDMITEAYGF
jgi:hypothetical protein